MTTTRSQNISCDGDRCLASDVHCTEKMSALYFTSLFACRESLQETFMGDIRLFSITSGKTLELEGRSVALEKSLQTLIENNLETLLGIRFLASEHSTGQKHGGRIDTLGIDENDCPAIIEYKRSLNENVINQGLFYLDWLLDHKEAFQLLVQEKFGKETSTAIEWSSPRLLCIAGDFNRYDENAVRQINRNIELIRYRSFTGLLLLELVNAKSVEPDATTSATSGKYKTITEILEEIDVNLRDRYESLKAFILALGDNIQEKTLKYYVAFRRLQNFACVEVRSQDQSIVVYVKVDPSSVILEEGFTRDMRDTGHYGTGDLEVRIRSDEDLERAKPLIIKSFESS